VSARSATLLLLSFLTAACGNIAHLHREAPPAGSPPRLLNASDTLDVARAWRKAGLGPTADGFTVTTHSAHPSLPTFTTLLDGYQIRTRLPLQDNAIGIPVLAGHGTPPVVSVQLTPHAHLLTLQTATLVATQVSPDHLQLDLYDPRGSANLNGQPLAAADGLIFDYIVREQQDGLLNLRGFLTPSDYTDRRGLYLYTPYDRDKIPVLFIHGLASSPLAFRDMVSHLQRDPALWPRYQFWFYFYPTGEPWLDSAAALRRDLTELITALDPDRNDSKLHDMVVVAHSMGGLMTRASISHNSEALYHSYFQQDLNTLGITPREKLQLRKRLLFEPLPWPRRVIFLATPHQGSGLAKGSLEWLALKLIRIPLRAVGGTFHVAQLLATGNPEALTSAARLLSLQGEVSVTQLNPNSPALLALQKMPMRGEVHLHSIIGDLGGPNLRWNTDAVVPYPSAHLDNTESEIIVRSNHGITDTPAAATEVARILRLHR